MMPRFVCAVDVGTGSARAGVFFGDGRLAGRGEAPIVLRRASGDVAEHDSEDIWQAVCLAVRQAVGASGVAAGDIAGLAFDATCSLVVRDANGMPVSVSPDGSDRADTIAWFDHRAMTQAEECSASGHEVLDYGGGTMSPEMQVPKLMWLKRNLPQSWARAAYFFDLTDYLSWRATGSTARSQCTLAAKWTYLAHHEEPWRHDFFELIGLGDMLAKGALPDRAVAPATSLGPLTADAAAALGLTSACLVGAGLIDAFAGALGVLGAHAAVPDALKRRMALIAGTSSCVMTMSGEPRRLRGFWGPYQAPVLPGLWLTEGGQSATGALLDHIVRVHGAGGEPSAELHNRIAARISQMRADGAELAPRLHVLPDFHGNRTPFAEPEALGVVSGLTLDASFDGLCKLYWRTSVGIALGVRHILDTMREAGCEIDALHVTGGHTRNPVLMELYADVCGCAVATAENDDAVMLGTAMVAASACGLHSSLPVAATAMAQPLKVHAPDPDRAAHYERDYRIFLEMHRHRQIIDEIAR